MLVCFFVDDFKEKEICTDLKTKSNLYISYLFFFFELNIQLPGNQFSELGNIATWNEFFWGFSRNASTLEYITPDTSGFCTKPEGEGLWGWGGF